MGLANIQLIQTVVALFQINSFDNDGLCAMCYSILLRYLLSISNFGIHQQIHSLHCGVYQTIICFWYRFVNIGAFVFPSFVDVQPTSCHWTYVIWIRYLLAQNSIQQREVHSNRFNKMFNLFRKPQLVNAISSGLRVANKPSVAAFCTSETPRRIEKSKLLDKSFWG